MIRLTALRKSLSIVIVMLLSLIGISKADGEQKEIKWLMIDWPPYMIGNDEGHWQGYGVNYLKHIQLSLQDYKHIYIDTRSAGINEAFKHHKNVCSIGLFPTEERSKLMAFSLPDQVFPPMRLWMRKESAFEFESETALSLRGLLAGEKLTLGLKDGIAYAGGIRNAIEGFETKPNIVRLNQKLMTEPLIKMLAKKRLDIVLEYSDMFQWVVSQNQDLQIEDYWGFDIEELASEVLYSRIACSKGEWGQNIIEKINRHLPALYVLPSYSENFYRYLSESEIKAVKGLLEKMHANPDKYMID